VRVEKADPEEFYDDEADRRVTIISEDAGSRLSRVDLEEGAQTGSVMDTESHQTLA
jgi:hypothetical protein